MLLGQLLKELPLHKVLPPPTAVQVYTNGLPGQAQYESAGTTRAGPAEEREIVGICHIVIPRVD